MTMSKNKKAFVAIVFGFGAAMIAGIPGRLMVFESSLMSWPNKVVAMAFVVWTMLRALGLLFYIPAAIGGYVSATFGPRRRREALVVGLLFIPGSMALDYIKFGFVSFAATPIPFLILLLVPFSALGGARVHWFLFRRAEE